MIRKQPLLKRLFFVELFLAFQLVVEDDAHDDADDAHDEAAEQGRPEPVYGEADAERLPDGAGEQEHGGVDDEGEQAEGEDDERAGEEFEQWAHQGVQEPDDECQPEDAGPAAEVLDAGDDPDCGV